MNNTPANGIGIIAAAVIFLNQIIVYKLASEVTFHAIQSKSDY